MVFIYFGIVILLVFVLEVLSGKLVYLVLLFVFFVVVLLVGIVMFLLCIWVWVNVMFVKYLFVYCYDYCVEWLCFIEMFGIFGLGVYLFDVCVVKVVVDIV